MFVSEEIYMEKLNRTRKITIYLPDSYEYENKHYPVMYINDGQNAFFDEQAYSGVSWGFVNCAKEHHYEVIMVAIPCNFEGYMRESEYGPWLTNELVTIEETGAPRPALGGEGDLYVEFIKDQLKPYIDHKYRTIVDDTAIVGSSSGGLISAYASLMYPDVFDKCAALSTCFWFYPEEMAEVIEHADLSALKCFYLDVGGHEGCGNHMLDLWYICTNDDAYELLKKHKETDKIIYRKYPDAFHNEGEWRKRVPVFMELFYGGK